MIKVKGWFIHSMITKEKTGSKFVGTFSFPENCMKYILHEQGIEGEGKSGKKYQATIVFTDDEIKGNNYPEAFRVIEFNN